VTPFWIWGGKEEAIENRKGGGTGKIRCGRKGGKERVWEV